MEALNHGDYVDKVNTKFSVAERDEPLDLELVEANRAEMSGGESFSLVFRGGKDQFLPQGLYNLEHESLENGIIFLVPVGEDNDGYLYEAVFNRMKPENESASAEDSAEETSTSD